MGAEMSTPLPRPDTEMLPWFAIVFRSSDTLSVVNADSVVLNTLRHVLQTFWPDGIQKEYFDNEHPYFKLRGYPFGEASADKDVAFAVRRATCFVISKLQAIGWTPRLSSDLCYTGDSDRSTWFFQKTGGNQMEKPTICVGLWAGDRILLINAPQNLHQVLSNVTSQRGVLQKEKTRPSSMEFPDFYVKLRGYPWGNDYTDKATYGRLVLMDLLQSFDAMNLRYVGNLNMNGTQDALFFQRDDSKAPVESKYAMVSFDRSDSIDLTNMNDETVMAVKRCIEQHWPLGFQKMKYDEQFNKVHLRMKGYPWDCDGEQEVGARHLMAVVLQVLLSKGWMVECALDVNSSKDDIGIFIMKSCAPTSMPHFCLSPLDSDELALLNAPDDVFDIVNRTFYRVWKCNRSLQQSPFPIEKLVRKYGGHVWHLQGKPWESYLHENASAHGSLLLCSIFQQLSQIGWRLIASVDLSAKVYKERKQKPGANQSSFETSKVHTYETIIHTRDTHSLFFVYTGAPKGAPEAGTVPSAPMVAPFGGDRPPSYTEATGFEK